MTPSGLTGQDKKMIREIVEGLSGIDLRDPEERVEKLS